MKRAAVIGSRSMLGRQLVERLRASGIETITVGRQASDDIHFDLEGTFRLDTERSVDWLFHCAASFGDDGAEGIRLNFRTNAASALAVAELAKRFGSGALVYAGSVSSDEALAPADLPSYGLSKRICEEILSWSLARQEIRFCSLRFAQLYDVEGRCCAHQPWFGRTIAYTSRGLDMRMPRSLGVRNFVHVQDAANLMIRAATGMAGGILNVTHPHSATSDEIAEMSYDVFGRGGKVVIAPEKQPFRRVVFPDSAATFELLGLTPTITIEEGIRMIRDARTDEAFGPMDLT